MLGFVFVERLFQQPLVFFKSIDDVVDFSSDLHSPKRDLVRIFAGHFNPPFSCRAGNLLVPDTSSVAEESFLQPFPDLHFHVDGEFD